MAVFFWILGLFSIVGGAAWIGLALQGALGAVEPGGVGTVVALFASFIAAGPGIAAVTFGFGMLAVAALLWALGDIKRNSADTVKALQAILNRGS